METTDRLDILQRIAVYSYTFDGKDAAGWAALFTEDGVWRCVVKEEEKPLEHLEGRDEIREWAAGRHGTIPDAYRSYHHQSGTVFDRLTADEAETRTMLIITGQDTTAEEPRGRQVRVTTHGVYHDQWVKLGGIWYIARRELVL